MLKNSSGEYFSGNGARSFIRRLAAEKERCRAEVTDHWESLCCHGNEIKSSLSMKNTDNPSVPKVIHLQYMISEEEVDEGHYEPTDYESQGRVHIELLVGERPKVLFLKSAELPARPVVLRRRPSELDACSITPKPSSTMSFRSSVSSLSTLTSIDLNLSDSDFETCDDEDDEVDGYDNQVPNGGKPDELNHQVRNMKNNVFVTSLHIESLKEEFKALSNEFKAWESRQALHNLSIRRLSQGLQELYNRRTAKASSISDTSLPPDSHNDQDRSENLDVNVSAVTTPESCVTPMMVDYKINDDNLRLDSPPSDNASPVGPTVL